MVGRPRNALLPALESDPVPYPWQEIGAPPNGECQRATPWIHLACKADPDHRFAFKSQCMRLDCPRCFPTVKARRGARRYEKIGSEGIGAWVLTVPDLMWSLLGPRAAMVLRKQAAECLRDWYASRYGVQVGIVAALHPTGDKCRGCYRSSPDLGLLGVCRRCGTEAHWSPHVDAVVPLVGLRDGQTVELPLWIPEPGLDALRLDWGARVAQLARERGYEGLAVRAEAGANLHYSYRRPGPEAAHRIRYCLRPFPAWSQELGSGARFGLYGLCSGGSRAEGLAQWREAVSDWTEEDVQSEPFKLPDCPCCGAELVIYAYAEHLGPGVRVIDIRGPP